MEAHNENVNEPTPMAVPAANLLTGHNRDEIDRICDQLEDAYQIGHFRHRAKAYRRYAPLRSLQLFNRLVTLYVGLFTTHWATFKHVLSAIADADLPAANDRIRSLALYYISSWFWDLHVSIRTCVAKISGTAFNQYFRQEVEHIAERYDPFLQHLNAIIRPTHIVNALEDTLYIPIISFDIDWDADDDNVFQIQGFVLNEPITHGLLDMMDNRNNTWSTLPLVSNNLGRPGWLFDYKENLAYAWFPMEANYSRVDLIAPHILGIPCTPRLGPRDYDEWQLFPGGALPAVIDVGNYVRVSQRNFYGSAEYRTIEHDRWTIPTPDQAGPPPPGSKRVTRGASSSTTGSKSAITRSSTQPTGTEPTETALTEVETQPQSVYRYRLVDWTYHAQVTIGVNIQTRNKALRSMIFSSSSS